MQSLPQLHSFGRISLDALCITGRANHIVNCIVPATAVHPGISELLVSTMAQQEKFSLNALDPQQLVQVRERLQNDVERFAQSLQFFGKSASIYQSAARSIQALNESKEGQPVMVPLTGSVYVSGEVAAVDTVLVDIGTGYYVEMTTEEAQDFCKRKVHRLQDNMAGAQEVLRQKQNQLVQVNHVLQEKVASMQAQQAQPQAAA